MAKEDWKQVDELALTRAVGAELGTEAWALFQKSKEAYRAYKAERDTFEAAMQAAFADKLPSGQELKFGYNFGKLSIAVGPISERKAQPKAAGESLGDWLAGQAQGGHRS